MDSSFLLVEARDHPELRRDRAVIVGSSRNKKNEIIPLLQITETGLAEPIEQIN